MTTVKIETFDEYMKECMKYQAQHPSWRMGQTMFNVLALQRPDLSERVRGSFGLDPFYAPSGREGRKKIDDFLAWVAENW